MKTVTQANNSKSNLALANIAFQKSDFDNAVSLYKQAMAHAEEPLKRLIGFNLRLAELRSQIKPAGSNLSHEIEVAQNPPSQSTTVENLHDIMRILEPHFDSSFYCAKYQDICKIDVDPLEHFCTKGWPEMRDPQSGFSTATYLELNPDVANAGINPFWHYVVAGKTEGRETRHPGGIKSEILKNLLSLEQIVKQWNKSDTPPVALTVAEVVQKLSPSMSLGIKSVAVSVGHDHYKKISGGIQLCIQREEQLADEKGMLYLNVHPWQPLPKLAVVKKDTDPLVSLVMAGKDIGVCLSSVLTSALKEIQIVRRADIYVIIHSLLGHSIEHVKDWVMVRRDHRCWLWLHDFFTLCPSYALQRNNVTFCGAPSIESNACTICIYGEERRTHMQRMDNFYKDLSVNAIAPSEVTKQFWLSKAKISPTSVTVLPHIEMPWTVREKPIQKKLKNTISIGFLGGQVYHKGWNVFEKLAQFLMDDSRYRFVHFGTTKPLMSKIYHVNVHVTASDCFAMSRAISEAEIDFVLHWATWPETFSFTTHEAIAGGAFVLTNPISGNVAAAVSSTGMGAVFPDESQLFNFFKENEAEKIAQTVRTNIATRICKPFLSEMTLPLLTKQGVA